MAKEVKLPPVGPDVVKMILPTVETEIRRLIQMARKFQRRGRSTRLKGLCNVCALKYLI